MSKPTILTVDDDPQVSAAITRDLRARYGEGYRIVRASSGPEALEVLTGLALRGRPVALIASDQRMPEMTGIELLEQSRVHAPAAKRLLLTAYADTDVAIRAINDIGLDYYLLKPWDPPEERLYPVDRRPARRLAPREPRPQLRRARRRSSVERPQPRAQELPRAQPRALPLVRHRARRRGRSSRRARGCRCRRAAARARARRRHAACAVDPRRRRRARPADQRGPGPLRPLHRRRRSRRARRRRLRRVRGPAHRDRRARVARRSGRAERGHRELPRLPQGAHRLRPHPARSRAGLPVRRRHGARPRRRRPRAARPGPRRHLRRRRDRGTRGARRHRRLLPTARRPTASTTSPAAGSTTAPARPRRRRPRATTSTSSAPRTPPGRRYSSSRGSPAASSWSCVDPTSSRPCRSTSSTASWRRPTSRCASAARSSPVSGDGHLETVTVADRDTGEREEVATNWLFVFIGASPRTDWLGDAVVRDEHGFVVTGQELLSSARVVDLAARVQTALRSGDQRARRVRRRRRAPRLDEAGGLRRRRGRDVGLPRPPLPRDRLMAAFDEVRALSIFDGVADDGLQQLLDAADEVAFEPGRRPLDRGAARQLLVGAHRGAHRPAAPRRTRAGGPRRARRAGPVGRRLPGLGRRGRLPRQQPLHRRRTRAARARRRAARGAPAGAARRPLHRRALPHGPTHRRGCPRARRPRRPRHAVGRPGARAQQPGRRRDPRGRQPADRGRRPPRGAAPPRRRRDHGRPVRRPRLPAPRDRAAVRRTRSRSRRRTARRSCPPGWCATTSVATGCSARRSPRPGSTRPGATGWRRCSTDLRSARASSGWRAR